MNDDVLCKDCKWSRIYSDNYTRFMHCSYWDIAVSPYETCEFGKEMRQNAKERKDENQA